MRERKIENIRSQMRKGTLEFATLLVISKGAAYTSEILAALKKADLLVVEGTLYPLLTRLKNIGLLNYNWQESKNGPPRKYYEITDKGRKSLQQLSKTWKNLSKSLNSLVKKYE